MVWNQRIIYVQIKYIIQENNSCADWLASKAIIHRPTGLHRITIYPPKLHLLLNADLVGVVIFHHLCSSQFILNKGICSVFLGEKKKRKRKYNKVKFENVESWGRFASRNSSSCTSQHCTPRTAASPLRNANSHAAASGRKTEELQLLAVSTSAFLSVSLCILSLSLSKVSVYSVYCLI